MTAISAPALRGRNPLGFFAALGALDVVTRTLGADVATLRWTDDLEPSAILTGPDSIDHLIELCDSDRQRWARSPILTWGPKGTPLPDLKPKPNELRAWFEVLRDEYRTTGNRADLDLMAGLLCEGGVAMTGDSKPTHLHFTAGQQLFLDMVRNLQANVDPGHLRMAIQGPWEPKSGLPVLRWDPTGERIYALTGHEPSSSKPPGVPGADWLAFLGLRYFPVALRTGRSGRSQLTTTGCSLSWKSGTFTWPLWNVPLGSAVVASLIADEGLVAMTASERHQLGVHHLLEAPIRRSDPGGYGSFGPPGPSLAQPTAPMVRR